MSITNNILAAFRAGFLPYKKTSKYWMRLPTMTISLNCWMLWMRLMQLMDWMKCETNSMNHLIVLNTMITILILDNYGTDIIEFI